MFKPKRRSRKTDEPAFHFSVEEIARMNDSRRQKTKTEAFITGAIAGAAASIMICLFVYLNPSSVDVVLSLAEKAHGYTVSGLARLRVALFGSVLNDFAEIEKSLGELLNEMSASMEEPETISYIDYTTELGDTSRFNLEPVYSQQETSAEGTIYSCMLDTAMGPLLYYSQGDARWRDYLYGGADPISRYGCGPVCAAMVINSFSSTSVTPVEIADWSLSNGCYAPQSGSYHKLIPDSISAYGLQVDSVTDRSVEHVTELLRSGRILVALMGKGSLTQNGHFIIIAQLCDNGNVYIADPASFENCTKEWDLKQLMNELKRSYDSGGPLWVVSIP